MSNYIDNIVYNLDIIATVAKGEKLNTKNLKITVDSPSILSSIYRMVRNDSRESTSQFLTNIIDGAISIIQMKISIYRDKEKDIGKLNEIVKIGNSLKKTTDGLKNISLTYSDRSVTATIDSLIDKISQTYGEICNLSLSVD